MAKKQTKKAVEPEVCAYHHGNGLFAIASIVAIAAIVFIVSITLRHLI